MVYAIVVILKEAIMKMTIYKTNLLILLENKNKIISDSISNERTPPRLPV